MPSDLKNLNSFKFYTLAFVFMHTVKEILRAWAMRSLENEDVSRTIYCSLTPQDERKMTAVQQVKCHDWLFRKLDIWSTSSYEIFHITTGRWWWLLRCTAVWLWCCRPAFHWPFRNLRVCNFNKSTSYIAFLPSIIMPCWADTRQNHQEQTLWCKSSIKSNCHTESPQQALLH